MCNTRFHAQTFVIGSRGNYYYYRTALERGYYNGIERKNLLL